MTPRDPSLPSTLQQVAAEIRAEAHDCRMRSEIACQKENDWHAAQFEQWADTLTALAAQQDEALEVERMRLAACTAAALGNTPASVAERIQPGHPYWTATYGDVCRAVDREMALREAQQDEHAIRAALEAIVGDAAGAELDGDYVGCVAVDDALIARAIDALAAQQNEQSRQRKRACEIVFGD